MTMSKCAYDLQHSLTRLPSQLLLATVLLLMSHIKSAHTVDLHTAQRHALATVCIQQPSRDQTLAPWQPLPSPLAALPIQLQIMAPQQLRLAASVRSAQQPRGLDMMRLMEELMTEQACRSWQTSYPLDQLLASTPGMHEQHTANICIFCVRDNTFQSGGVCYSSGASGARAKKGRQYAFMCCSDVAGWAPNAGPSHGYNTGDGPTRFTAGHVASDYEGNVSNSRNDITGPTASAATITADKGNTLPPDKPPHYITNEAGDVVGIKPVGIGTSGCTPSTSHAQQAGVATTGYSTAHTSQCHGHHRRHGKGTSAHDMGSGQGSSDTGRTSQGMRASVAPNTGIGSADAFSGDGPRYITNEYGDVLGTEPREAV